MKIIWIRHGKTAGNLQKRYIGRTDEPLCPQGREELCGKIYPGCSRLFASPMKRCLETAKLIYPGMKPEVFGDLRECDFGEFEGKNYLELSGNPDYQAWIDSKGKLPFPNGESHEEFRRRCCRAFCAALADCSEEDTAAFVVHGGTIMAVLAQYGAQHRDMYAYQAANGCGYVTEYERKKGTLTIISQLD